MTFVQPPFWATRYRRALLPHAISKRVTSTAAIVASSIAPMTVITTATPHGLVTGDTVAILNHVGSTPALDGWHVVTVLTPATFSVLVTVTIAGTGGTVTRTIPVEPLTLVEGKLRAGLDWPDGDPRDQLMAGFISAARAQVEMDTEFLLLTQWRDVYLDLVEGSILTLPGFCRPLQEVTSIKTTDTAGVVNTLDPANYVVDLATGRIGLSVAGVWPMDLRYVQPWVIRIVAGWPSVESLKTEEPMLVHAVGLMTAHYATAGRDIATIVRGTPEEMPFGYADAIAPYRHVVVA